MELKLGIKGKQMLMVDEDNTAAAMGSGLLPVFATPSMIAMMEAAAMNSVSLCIDTGDATVGTMISVKHLSATPIGMVVRAESELVGIDGRRLTFSVKAYDECGLIGEGTHERFIVHSDPFVKKANAKEASILK